MIKEEDKKLLLKELSLRLPYKMKFKSPFGVLEMNEINLTSRYPVLAYTTSFTDFNFKTLKSIPCQGHGFELEKVKPVQRYNTNNRMTFIGINFQRRKKNISDQSNYLIFN